MKKDRLRITTSDGKYTVIQPMHGPSTALRYGEKWAAYEGKSLSNLELALAYDLESTRLAIIEAQKFIDYFASTSGCYLPTDEVLAKIKAALGKST